MAGDAWTWQDGERTIRFGRGALRDAPSLLGEDYVLLTTERARPSAPAVVEGAASVHDVAHGLVDELAAALLDEVPETPLVVALGGGRVVDTAKAIAGARGDGVRAAAIPTTLSAAEMTKVHRTPAGVAGARRVRPAIVVNDPALCASQPPADLAASAANSLAHAAEGLVTTLASPVPRLAATEAARLTVRAYEGAGEEPGEDARDALALAALLSGYAIDAAWYGLHHVLSQTLVRVGGAGHGQANAAMLPHTLRALHRRSRAASLVDLEPLARDLAARAGASSLSALGLMHETLEACADAAAERSELDLTPPRAGRDELLRIYETAL